MCTDLVSLRYQFHLDIVPEHKSLTIPKWLKDRGSAITSSYQDQSSFNIE